MEKLLSVVRGVCIGLGFVAALCAGVNVLDRAHPILTVPAHVLMPAIIVWGGLLFLTAPGGITRRTAVRSFIMVLFGIIAYLVVPPCIWDGLGLVMVRKLPYDYVCP